jgi:site-specific DNA-methyltransferase (adenine-specific)
MGINRMGKIKKLSDYLYFQNEYITLYNCSYEEGFKTYIDNQFDLVFSDPDYGVYSEKKVTGFAKKRVDYGIKSLGGIPDQKYFDEIKRISLNQIVWGGNYFGDFLGKCIAPIIWDKCTGDNYFADGEMAWTSFKTGTLRIFKHQWCGCFKDSERVQKAFHPTQKPVVVYLFILNKFGKKGMVILDTHAGSLSLGLACMEFGCFLTAFEIKKEYCKKAVERIKRNIRNYIN